MLALPYIDRRKDFTIPLLIVSPIKPIQKEAEGGLVIPEGAGEECQQGIVEATCQGSTFKKGDVVTYKLIDRTRPDNFEEFHANDKDYDIIGESEVWDVNEVPYGRVFVQPLSSFDVAMDGLILPDKVQGVTQKGKVIAAPSNYFCKEGDTVEYRTNEKRIYRQATVKRIQCDVVFEPDLYLINGEVSPHRVIIKIDIAAQRLKRGATNGGLALSPLFISMMHNLQIGEVHAIGSEAQKNYPDMKVGDTAIFYHTVEEHPHRLLWQESGNITKVVYEYRMIECFNPNAREIFGKIDGDKAKLNRGMDIIPYGKCVFFDWNFELFEKEPESILDTEMSLEKCIDIDDLRNTIHRKTQEATDSFKKKAAGYSADMDFFAYDNPEDREKIQLTGQKMDQLKAEALRMARFTKKNYLLKLKVLFHGTLDKEYDEVIASYKELYPINVLGKKYLIGHIDYATAYLNNNTNMSTLERTIPIGDQVLILPIAEEDKGGLVIAEDAKEKPQVGTAIVVGKDVDPTEIQPGDTVYYRKRTGIEIQLDGVEYLILRRNSDIFVAIKGKPAETIA